MVDNETLRKMTTNLVAEPTNYIDSFRKNLYMYIDRKDITLSEVAELADIPISTLKTFLYGNAKDCHLSTAIKLARVFHVSIDELVGAGTITPQTCKTLQLVRQLPESYTYFIHWVTRYHYDLLTSNQVTEHSIEVMFAECNDLGNLKATNNVDVLDISSIDKDLRPKIFMGVRIPNNMYAPIFFEGNVLLIANDRNPRPTEKTLILVDDNIFFAYRKEEIEDGQKVINYYSVRDGLKRANNSQIKFEVGYVTKILPEMPKNHKL